MKLAGSRRTVVAVVGLGVLVVGLATQHPAPAWGALCAVWLLATGAALGLVALLAATRVTSARWLEPLVEYCSAGVRVLPWSFAVLLFLIGAGHRWIPWLAGAFVLGPERHWWFNLPAFALREIVATAGLFALAVRVVDVPRWSRAALTWSIAFLIAFACVLTLWALDFIMALDRQWVSPLVGAFYFMGMLLAAAALLALETSRERYPAELRHDVGKLLFALSVFWVYLLWAQFLTQWYGNLPEEIAFWILREHGPWRGLGLAAIVLVFGLPFFALMRETAKRETRILSLCALAVLVGLGLSLLVLILPALAPRLSLAGVLGSVGSLLALTPFLDALRNGSRTETPSA
jgi:hypothetical protein